MAYLDELFFSIMEAGCGFGLGGGTYSPIIMSPL